MTQPLSSQYYLQALENPEKGSFNFTQIPGFPTTIYHQNLSKYTEAERWYSGAILDDVTTKAGEKVELYPVKVNPLKSTVQKHAYALFGEIAEDDRPLVIPHLVWDNEAQKVVAEAADRVLWTVWHDSNGRSLQWQNGALSQVYGGCIFRIDYDPLDKLRTYPIRVDLIHPKNFVGIPASNDMYELKDAWIVQPISVQEARERNVPISNDDPYTPYLVEHYTQFSYEAWINEYPVQRFTGEEWIEVSGLKDWGFVPIVYIPHIRVNGFYGENVFDTTKGIIREINSRLADYGDAVSQESHQLLAMANVNGVPQVVEPVVGYPILNLGSQPQITGDEKTPDVWDIGKATTSSGMGEIIKILYDQYRRDVFVPPVADGEDEGSQRSGLTLAMRMLSLLWHTTSERVFWTDGLNKLNKMILRMMALRELGDINERHTVLRMKQEWQPILPRDREVMVNEVVARMGAKLGSPQTLLRILGDVVDVDQEIKDIIEFSKDMVEAQSVPMQQPQGGGPNRGTPGTSVSKSKNDKEKEE